MKNFSEVTDEVIALSKDYYDIDEQLGNMYLDTISVFIESVKRVYSKDDDFSIDRDNLKLSVFESIFNVNLNAELKTMARAALEEEASGEIAEDIKESNADQALLDSIRANIDSYIKE